MKRTKKKKKLIKAIRFSPSLKDIGRENRTKRTFTRRPCDLTRAKQSKMPAVTTVSRSCFTYAKRDDPRSLGFVFFLTDETRRRERANAICHLSINVPLNAISVKEKAADLKCLNFYHPGRRSANDGQSDTDRMMSTSLYNAVSLAPISALFIIFCYSSLLRQHLPALSPVVCLPAA